MCVCVYAKDKQSQSLRFHKDTKLVKTTWRALVYTILCNFISGYIFPQWEALLTNAKRSNLQRELPGTVAGTYTRQHDANDNRMALKKTKKNTIDWTAQTPTTAPLQAPACHSAVPCEDGSHGKTTRLQCFSKKMKTRLRTGPSPFPNGRRYSSSDGSIDDSPSAHQTRGQTHKVT